MHLAQIRLDPSPGDTTIGVRVVLSGTPQAAYQVICTVTAPDGQVVGSGVLKQDLTGVIRLDSSPDLWSPDAPNLYTVTATLHVNGNPTHSVQKTCGFRMIEARNGRIYLNGDPIYLRGVLDQGYYPETIYTPNSLELLEAQAHSAKALGFNCLRIHIKVEDPRYYDVADRLGLLVWTEIPNWALLTDASAGRARQTFDGMVERDGHHPSIIAWTLVNENWGTVFSEPKSAAGKRVIVLSTPMVEKLREHMACQQEARQIAGSNWQENDLIFSSPTGNPLHSRYVYQDFKNMLKKAGLPDMRFHDLRHTAATLMLQQGIHPKIVQECLGHSDISLTLNTYSHVLPSMQEDAAEKMGELMKSIDVSEELKQLREPRPQYIAAIQSTDQNGRQSG